MRPVFVVQSDLLNELGHGSTEVMIDESTAIDNRRLVRELRALPPVILREVEAKLRLAAGL